MAEQKTKKKEYNLHKTPVVTLLGHVDHGKTSILDAISGTKIQACEAGGITQSIRAHKIEYVSKKNNKYSITFIDTPGHEAFSEMRSRGTNVTDIALLVVAVDDGVQPQTKEAIKYIKDFKVPVLVALNKVDIEGTDKSKIKRDLANEGIQSEKLGGDVIFVEVSAKKKTGINELLENILLVAELNQKEPQLPKEGIAEAVVLESTTDKSLGPISFCLVKSGSFKVGNFVSWDNSCSTIRAIKTDTFCNADNASESEPVWLAGFSEEIPVGVKLTIYPNQKVISTKEKEVSKTPDEEKEEFDEDILVQLIKTRDENSGPELNVVVKSESQGTLEVVMSELEKIKDDEVKLNVIESGTGDITEDDILKAKTSSGIVIGFRSCITKNIEKVAKQEKVLVNNYEIIYHLVDEIKEVIDSFKEPVEKEVVVAKATVKKVFELSDNSKVAGCKVAQGTILKGYRCYVERKEKNKSIRIGEGKITSLKFKKDEVREAPKGTECGIVIEPKVEFKKDDEIVCFKLEKV